MKNILIALLALTTFGGYAQDTTIYNYSSAPKKFKKGIDKMLVEYLKMKDAFVEDDTISIKYVYPLSLNTEMMHVKTEKLTAEHKEYFEKHANQIALACKMLSTQQGTMQQNRQYFEQITHSMYALLKSFKANKITVYKQYCPMAFNRGAFWLSDREVIINPYFGSKMLHCGDVVEVMD